MRYFAPVLLLAAASQIPVTYAQQCLSSASITCTLKPKQGTDDTLSCEDHLKIQKADCPTSTSVVNTAVIATFSYCNDNTSPIVHRPILEVGKTFLKFKQVDVAFPNKSDFISPNTCKTMTVERNVDLCSRGAKARMKFEGHSCDPGQTNCVAAVNDFENYLDDLEYCYNFRFLSAQKKWLPPTDCAVEPTVTCTINETGEPCKGNIIRTPNANPSSCNVDVTLRYSVCNYHLHTLNAEYNFLFDGASSSAKLTTSQGIEQVDFPFTALSTTEFCRTKQKRITINACSDASTEAVLTIKGRLEGQSFDTCSTSGEISITPQIDRSCEFIITEIADPNEKDNRFIEIYTDNNDCKDTDITENLYLVMYEGSDVRPSNDAPISLKGKTVAADGFIVFCASEEGKITTNCDYVAGEGSPADSDGNDTFAIVSGTFSDIFESGSNTPLTILDQYGTIGESATTNQFSDGRVSRDCSNVNPNNGVFLENDFIVETGIFPITSSMTDPHAWASCCTDFDFVITEVADTSVPAAHFVEIYSDRCKGQQINGNYKLVAYNLSGALVYTPTNIEIVLDNRLVPSHGFLVFCKRTEESVSEYQDKCNDYASLVGESASYDQTTVAITQGNTILDVYGNLDNSVTNDPLNQGRAVRKIDVTDAKGTFDTGDWVVIEDVLPKEADPQVWVTVVNPPTDPPSDPPSDPPLDTCTDLSINIIITEVTSSYIELYNLIKDATGCDQAKIEDTMFLSIYKDDGAIVRLGLKDLQFDVDGFIILQENSLTVGRVSTITLTDENSITPVILDQFGLLGSSCDTSLNYCISGGSAVRKKDVVIAQNADFPRSSECAWREWDIYSSEDNRVLDRSMWSIDENTCSFDFLITEIADPPPTGTLQFIEIYSHTCGGKTIRGDYAITTGEDTLSTICLNTRRVNTDGFLVFCQDLINTTGPPPVYGDKCDSRLETSLHPEDKVKIVHMPDFVHTILDTYGIYDYSTGRAVRTLGSTQAPVFDINDWFIRKPEEAIDTDPRVWQDIHCPGLKNNVIITEIVAPNEIVFRYIELHNLLHTDSGRCYEAYINDLLTLDVLDQHGDTLHSIDLQGMTFSSAGFIVLCYDSALNYNGKCTGYVNDEASAANSDGRDSTIVLRGPNSAGDITIIDQFGILGTSVSASDCDGNISYCFIGGSATRKKSTTAPNDSFPAYRYGWLEWELHDGLRNPDPDAWEDELPCDFDFIITEIADPHTGFPSNCDGIGSIPHTQSEAQFIEIYTENCKGKTIHDDFFIVVRDPITNAVDNLRTIELTGRPVPTDGFLVFCNRSIMSIEKYGTKCDFYFAKSAYNGVFFDSLFEMHGESIVSITRKLSGVYFDYDIYGSTDPGVNHDFSSGRVVRKTSCTTPQSSFSMANYIIRMPELAEDTDPDVWTDVVSPCTNLRNSIVITEIVSDSSGVPYVELYNLRHGQTDCFQATIVDFLSLDVFKPDGTIETGINLRGMTFSRNGFIVLCGDNSPQCTETVNPQFIIASTSGTAPAIALHGRNLQGEKEIIDLFGILNSEYLLNCVTSIGYCFTDGSALRKKSFTSAPDPYFTLYTSLTPQVWEYWDIYADGSRTPDPDNWDDEVRPTSHPTTSPSRSQHPSSNPTCIGKGCYPGYSGKGKGKRHVRNLRHV